jgi:Domain of unknown function (DUF1937)
LPDIAHSHSVALHGRLGPHDISIWRPLARVMSAACHTLLVAHLPNWDKSEGIADEVMCFEQAGKPIFDLDPATLVSTRRGHGVPHQQKRFEAMTLAELHAERAGWDAQIKAAKAWGASLAAAAEFRNACDVWIARREAEPVLAHRQDTVPAGRLVRMRLFFFNVELQLGQAINPLEASRPFEASARDSFCGVFHPRKSFGNHYAVQVIKRGRYRLLVTSLYSVIVEAVHGAAADLRKGRQDVPHLTEFGWRAGKRHLELAGQTHCAESSGISPSIRRRCSIAFFDDVVAKRLERSLHLFERLRNSCCCWRLALSRRRSSFICCHTALAAIHAARRAPAPPMRPPARFSWAAMAQPTHLGNFDLPIVEKHRASPDFAGAQAWAKPRIPTTIATNAMKIAIPSI